MITLINGYCAQDKVWSTFIYKSQQNLSLFWGWNGTKMLNSLLTFFFSSSKHQDTVRDPWGMLSSYSQMEPLSTLFWLASFAKPAVPLFSDLGKDC